MISQPVRFLARIRDSKIVCVTIALLVLLSSYFAERIYFVQIRNMVLKNVYFDIVHTNKDYSKEKNYDLKHIARL